MSTSGEYPLKLKRFSGFCESVPMSRMTLKAQLALHHFIEHLQQHSVLWPSRAQLFHNVMNRLDARQVIRLRLPARVKPRRTTRYKTNFGQCF